MAQFEETPVTRWVKPTRTTDGQFDFTEPDNLLARDYIQGNLIQLVRNITPSGTSAQEVKITDGIDELKIGSDGNLRDFSLNLASASRSSVGTTTIYTAINTAKIYFVSFVLSDNNAVDFRGSIKINGVPIASHYNSTTGIYAGFVSFNKPVKLTSGQIATLELFGYTSGTATAVIGYVDE